MSAYVIQICYGPTYHESGAFVGRPCGIRDAVVNKWFAEHAGKLVVSVLCIWGAGLGYRVFFPQLDFELAEP